MTKPNGEQPRGVDRKKQVTRHTGGEGRSGSQGRPNGAGGLVGNLLAIGGRVDREAKIRVFGARTSAMEAWERLETAFAQRVARALNSLQIPTARDVRELNARVEALQKAIVAIERRAAEAAGPKPQIQARRKATARVRAAGRKK
jgi:polyhydroxyalkanoate synthesis regulator phasin